MPSRATTTAWMVVASEKHTCNWHTVVAKRIANFGKLFPTQNFIIKKIDFMLCISSVTTCNYRLQNVVRMSLTLNLWIMYHFFVLAPVTFWGHMEWSEKKKWSLTEQTHSNRYYWFGTEFHVRMVHVTTKRLSLILMWHYSIIFPR